MNKIKGVVYDAGAYPNYSAKYYPLFTLLYKKLFEVLQTRIGMPQEQYISINPEFSFVVRSFEIDANSTLVSMVYSRWRNHETTLSWDENTKSNYKSVSYIKGKLQSNHHQRITFEDKNKNKYQFSKDSILNGVEFTVCFYQPNNSNFDDFKDFEHYINTLELLHL